MTDAGQEAQDSSKQLCPKNTCMALSTVFHMSQLKITSLLKRQLNLCFSIHLPRFKLFSCKISCFFAILVVLMERDALRQRAVFSPEGPAQSSHPFAVDVLTC